MALTEMEVRQAKGRERSYTLGDGNGLILEVRKGGAKYWIARMWTRGDLDPETGARQSREVRRSLGKYPEVSLKEAREKNHELRKSFYTAEAPGAPGASPLFGDVVSEWLDVRILPRMSDSYVRVIRVRLDKWVLPEFRGLRLEEVTSKRILDLCRRIGARGTHDTANRVKQLVGNIFRYAVATGAAEGDPTAALSGALTPAAQKHRAAITDEREIGELMHRITAYRYTVMRCALLFSALTFCRPGEIRHAQWADVDLEKRD